MSARLFRLGRSSARHPFRVLGLWLLAAIAIVAVKGAAGGEFDDTFRVPGVESQTAADVLHDRFPARSGQTARIVLHADGDRLEPAAVDGVRRDLADGTDVTAVTDAVTSADGRTAFVDVSYGVDKLTGEHDDDATAAAADGRDAGVQTELTGVLAQLGA